jgi:hypothetical protein
MCRKLSIAYSKRLKSTSTFIMEEQEATIHMILPKIGFAGTEMD